MDHPVGDPFGGPAYGRKDGWFSDIFGGVGESISNFFTEVGKGFEKFGQEVLKPIGKAVEKIGQGIANDPLTFIATVAAMVTQQYWAIPLITAASTAAKGGSFEDVLKATAISAAATFIGVQGTEWIQNGVVQAGTAMGVEVGATTANVIANVTAFSASGALSAAAQGQDIGQGALMGGVQAALSLGINAALKEIPGYVELGGTKEAPNYVGRAIQTTVQTTVAGIAGAAIAGKDLTTAAANSVIKGVMGGLTDGVNYVVKTVSNYFEPTNVDMPEVIKDMPPEVKAIAADALTQVVASAVFTGGKAPINLTNSFMKGATSAINKYVTGDFVKDVTKLTDNLNLFNSDPAVQEYTRAAAVRDEASGAYGKVADEIAPLFEERDVAYEKAKAAADAYNANPTAENKALATAAGNDYKAKEDAVNAVYNGGTVQYGATEWGYSGETVSLKEAAARAQADVESLKTYSSYDENGNTVTASPEQIAEAQAKADQYKAMYENTYAYKLQVLADKYAIEADKVKLLEPKYAELYKTQVGDAASPINAKTNELIKGMADEVVTDLNPGWKEEEYKALYGYGDGVSGSLNYLQEGMSEGRYVNLDQAAVDLDTSKADLMDRVAQAQGYQSAGQLAQADKAAYKKLANAVETEYGNGLSSIKAASVQDFIKGQTTQDINDLVPKYDSEGVRQINITQNIYSASSPPPEEEFTLPSYASLATQEQIASGQANLTYTDNGDIVWIYDDGKVKQLDDNGEYVDVDVRANKVKADNLNEMDAWTMVNTFNSMNEEALVKVLPNAAESVEFVHNILDAAKSTNSAAVINGTAMVLKGGTELVRAYNDMAIMMGKDPRNDNLRKTLDSMTGMITASNTQEYKDELNNIKTLIKDSKGVGVVGAILEGATTYPATFAMEYIGTELVQEGIQWALGGGVGKAVQWGAKGLGYVQDAVKMYTTMASKGTFVTSNVAEAAGGEAGNAYDQTYKLALQQGKSESQAHELAMTNAFSTGLVAATVNLATLGVGLDVMPSILYGGKEGKAGAANLFGDLLTGIKDGSLKIGRETLGEAAEEGLTSAWLEGQLYKLDPNRDVAKEIAESATMGAIAGGGVVTALTGADASGDFIYNLTKDTAPILKDLITGGPSTIGYAFATPGSVGGVSLDTATNQVAAGTEFIADSVKAAKAVTDTKEEAVRQLYIDMTGHEPTKAEMAKAKADLAGGKIIREIAAEIYNDPYVQIKNLYQTVLDRAPTNEELTKGIGDIKSGTTNIGALTTSVYNSTEARTGRVESLFKDVLGRDATQEELNQRLAELEAGKGFDELKNEFFNSEERTSKISNEALVNALYKNVLNRDVTAEERQQQLDELNSGRKTAGQLESELKSSSENIIQDTLATLQDLGITDKAKQVEIISGYLGEAGKDNATLNKLREEANAAAEAATAQDAATTDLGEVYETAQKLGLRDITLADLQPYTGDVNEAESLQKYRVDHAQQAADAAIDAVYGKDYVAPTDRTNDLVNRIVNDQNTTFDSLVNDVLQPQKQVGDLYKQVIGLEMPMENLLARTAQITSGELNYQQLKSMFEGTTKNQVADTYQRYLGRLPTQQELDSYTNAINTGYTTVQELATQLQATPEAQKYSTTSKPLFNDVASAYKAATGLDMPTDKLTLRAGEIASGQNTIADYSTAIANSTQAKVAQAYKAATGVDISADKLAQRVSEINSGQTSLADYQTAVANSTRAQVAQAYKAATGTALDSATLEQLTNQVKSGTTTVTDIASQYSTPTDTGTTTPDTSGGGGGGGGGDYYSPPPPPPPVIDPITKETTTEAKKVANYNNLINFVNKTAPSAVQQVEAKTPPPEPIEYFYNFEDIFANPKQSAFYKSPYESIAGAKGDFGDRYSAEHLAELASGKLKRSNEYVYNMGGAVEYTDMDDIIRILRGK